jgi:hypothetical protein
MKINIYQDSYDHTITVSDAARVDIDGVRVDHMAGPRESNSPLSERLEVGDSWDDLDGIIRTAVAIKDGWVAYWGLDNGQLFGHAMPLENIAKHARLVDKPLLSETVRPGWKIKCPDGATDRVFSITSDFVIFLRRGHLPLTELDRDGYEVVSRG